MTYRLWVSEDRKVLVRMWDNGHVEVCVRPEQEGIWSPPISVFEERV